MNPDQAALRERIIAFVIARDNVSFAELEDHVDGVRGGDVALHLPGFENIIIRTNLAPAAADVLAALLNEKIVHAKPTSSLVYLVDGSIPRLPLARQARQYKTPHLIPIVLKPGPGPEHRNQQPDRGRHA